MITKERLQELIEQGAIIYKLTHNNRIDCRRLRSKMKIVDNSLYFNYKDPHLYSNSKWCYSGLYRLFETKEDAEWHKEFGCIERTERLELPTWEEIEIKFNKKQIIERYFYYAKHFSAPKENNVEKTYSIYLLTNGHIVIDDNREVKTIFNEELTKENYTLACRKAKELFLGEKK